MDAKKLLLDNTLKSEFDIGRFVRFIKEFFNKVELISPDKENEKVWAEYKYYIHSYFHVAKYTDSKKNNILILAVKLQKGRTVDKARSLQRNFISKLISDTKYDAAIVAFYNGDEPSWRLSFVRLDVEFVAGKVKTTLTPAKRYSYLVGKGEPTHTAQERLYPIFKVEDFNPSLDAVEEAFSVEAVTKDFFEKYKEKYYSLKEHLDSNDVFIDEAERCQFTSEQFAKKLMGQLAFLYFLQKKGWLGVKVAPHELTEKEFKDIYYNQTKTKKMLFSKMYMPTSEGIYKLRNVTALDDVEADVFAGCFSGSSFDKENGWGSGTKTFIRDIFMHCTEKAHKNFFDDYLEPLFYDALNKRRGDNHYYSRFNCKIPFLNGGLFDALENYDWKHNKFEIPNEIFSNVNVKGKDDADGILDIFDRYNFTMNEDEPLEKEVAVDPEMLGKIFENLLDVKDRKSKGAFYTPREIVHYMCQEGLINYLVNKVDVPYEDIKDFILYGELMKDEDCSMASKEKGFQQRIPKSIYDKLFQIDRALQNVKVADPAVGSGAFPLGMLNEIVRARINITEYFVKQIPEEKKYERLMFRKSRHAYKIKWETIKNCIFAVDIEHSAVDIAKLRLWLSIVVEQEIDDENLYPHALPNLDCNIMCGNSLIDEFDGIKLFDERLLNRKGDEEKSWQISLFEDQMKDFINELFKEQDRLFGEDEPLKKQEIKKNIDMIIDNIIRIKLSSENNSEGLRKYEEVLKMKSKPYFLWQLEFGKIFMENGGFDIVIGNPPYIDSENMVNSGMEDIRNIIASKYEFTKGNWDIYIAFFELGFKFLSESGNLIYITPDKWISKPFGDELRKHLIGNIYSLLTAGRKVFESAKVDAIVTQFTKKTTNDINVFEYEDAQIRYKRSLNKKILSVPYTLDILFSDSIDILTKLEADSILLGSLNKCENACATSDAYKIKEIITQVDSSVDFNDDKHLKIINTGTIDKYVPKWGVQSMTYLKDKYLYPIVEKKDFFEYFKNTYAQKSIKPKIIIKGLTLLDACLDDRGTIIPGKSTMIIANEDTSRLKFLLAIINSKLYFFYIKQKYSSSSYNGGINFTKDMINSLPIKKVSYNEEHEIVNIVDEIIKLKAEDRIADISKYEDEINQYIYGWHNLNEEEIRKIEGR